MSHIVRPADHVHYSPANHTGTRNARLVSQALNGARRMEIVLGEIARNEGAPAHAHPDMEQAVYVLEGEAVAGIDGVDHTVRAGDLMFFPAGVFHSIRVVSETVRMLVIYSPPYAEDAARVIHAPDAGA